ncbi:hypothetical protein GN244_ATG00087 [Phytophthora infestans]|uniref:RanBP2-type domain-containing protein n=1 Tax=Phytophthora infestans TaxID=4787 RepID=A0A833TI51_PHYIN|nr:hypothetical protein GN244_ATG00087 [Phytophthora infestans]
MLTESASLSAPLDSGERRAEARHRRREAAAPYSKRTKAAEDEDDVEFFARETDHNRRGSGFLARLASYIPIVNKLVTEKGDEEEAELQPAVDTSVDSIDIRTTQEDVDEEDEAQEETEKEQETPEETQKETPATPEPLLEKSKEPTPEDEEMPEPSSSPVTRAAPSFVTPKEQFSTPPRPPSKRGSRKSRSPSRDSSVDSGERSPAMMRQQRKRGDKRVFLPGPSQQSKMLRISNSLRRRKSTSPSPHDSALAVIKQKKTITMEEFERLQKQLHDMVETTPHTQLAMAQAALANGLERPFTRGFPGPTSFPGYVPGSIANQNHGALTVRDERKEIATKSGVPFGKRPRNHENGPILLSGSALRGQLTREERLMRKPRPSRLLTGAQRDAAARNAYSAAVAEKILSTLNKVQTPLEREAQKPTPSTSMSWAKYHLSIANDEKKSLENGMAFDSDDVAPPTSTVPRVAFPQPSQKPATLTSGSVPKASTTPMKGATSSSNDGTAFSPQAVSMTPALTRVPEQAKFEKIGEFKFTLPHRVDGVNQVGVNDEDTRVKFVFSPPPKMREPPVKVSSQKTAANGIGAAPFDFMPSSPKTKTTEWASKPPKTKESEKPKAAEKPVAPKDETEKPSTVDSAPAASTNGVVNPLARFMQLKPGQWKCPGCSVLNEATSAKCPCCETANPAGASAPKVTAPLASKPAGSISSSGFSFGAPAADAKMDADKPTAGSITASGFSFGAPLAESKKELEKPAGSISSSGFSFGAPASAAANKDSEKPVSGITSGGFSFTTPAPAPASASDKPTVSFGVPAVSDSKSDGFGSAAPISFGFSPPAKKNEDTPKICAVTEKAAASSFSHGASPSTSALAASTATTSGFTFGATNASTADNSSKSTKRKAHELGELKKDSTSLFSFGTTATATTEAPKASAPAFSFGASPEPKHTSPKEDSDRPKKRMAPSSMTTGSKPVASNPAFSFGGVSKPPQVPAKNNTGVNSPTPSFSFGGSNSSTTTDKPKETAAPSFSFCAASTDKPAESKPKETTPLTTGFTFGSSSTTSTSATKPSAGFGQATTESKGPAFSFGASTASPAPATSTPATTAPTASTGFTFGQSSTTSATSNAPAFGAAPATSSGSSFGFGVSTAPSTGTSDPPVPAAPASTPAFTFGSSSTQSAASSGFGSSGSATFGQTPATTSGFGSTSAAFGSGSSAFGSGASSGGFGSSSSASPSTAFGSSASTAPAAPAFSFGASIQAPATNASANQPAFSFGATSVPTPTGFGAAPAPSSGFGSSAPGGFRSSSPAPAFGNQSAPAAPVFGNSLPPPTNTFGAPAFGAPPASGFGGGPPSSGFRTPSPTPAFGAAPGAPAFGAAPAPTFGAPPAAPAFGAAPAAGAFGAPSADGGFNMGAAPQHVKGRRILKAKTRTRRTS